MTTSSRDLLDRYLRGDASPAERRALEDQALQDQELFDLLMTVGLGQEAMRNERLQRHLTPSSRPWASRGVVIMSGLAAAAIILIAVGLTWWAKRTVVPAEPSPTTAAHRPATPPAPTPATPVRPANPPTPASARTPMPVFLSARLDVPASGGTTLFRGTGAARRPAKQVGRVVSVDHAGIAHIDMGAIDSLKAGWLVVIDADPANNLPATRGKVVSVIRDEAEVEVGADVRPGRTVRLSATDQLRAVADQMSVGLATGNREKVDEAIERASTLMQSSDAAADAHRLVLLQLAVVARTRNQTQATERYVRQAVQLADTPPPATPVERAELLNALGMVLALDALATDEKLAEAEAALLRAQKAAPAGSIIAAEVLNNLGGVAARRSDSRNAAALYKSALTILTPASRGAQREVVEKNLSRLGAAQ